MKLGDSLRAGLLAGVLAGVVLSLFSLAFTTPLIDRAIALEESVPGARPEMFTRGMQKFGMVLGFLLYGVMMGVLFGALYAMLKEKLPVKGSRGKGILLAFLAYLSIVLLPFLKYPANPPGMGGEENIAFRQATYAAIIAISVLLTVLSVWWFKYLARVKYWQWLIAISSYILVAALAYFLMPPHQFPPVTLPTSLLWSYRAMSLAGMTLFWFALGINFVLLGKRLSQNTATGKLAD